jgi:uncharacterized repeat protein (TIGR03803 family)
MNSAIFRRMCRAVFAVSCAWLISTEARAASLPPVLERVQALPLSPKESRVKLLEIGGEFYGTSQRGGTSDLGTFYKLATDGTLTILVNFNGTNGSTPKGGLILGMDGALYGTTEAGGTSGQGTVFRVTTTGILSTLASFPGGANGSGPLGGVTLATDGNFYGTTSTGGAWGKGTVFKMTPAGILTSLASFNGTNGQTPSGRLVADAGGLFYGVCQFGGTSNAGTVFTVTTGGTITRLVEFNGTNGSQPVSTLLPDGGGNFLGTCWGGFTNSGSVFRVTPAGTLTTLVNFNGVNGRLASGELTLGADGNYYGTTYSGGALYNANGTVFKMTPLGVLTTVATFTTSNGAGPAGGVVVGSDGNFYGVTSVGGTTQGGWNSLNGVFFRLTPQGVLTVRSLFLDSIGRKPMAGLVLGPDGNFYGTASEGGGNAYGSFFRMTPQGVLSVVHHCRDMGLYPKAPLTLGTGSASGYLFGTTTFGGPLQPQANGTVLKINPATDAVTIDQRLNIGFSVSVGAQTVGPVVNLGDKTYGMTSVGGSGSLGTFVRMQGGTATTLANFSSATGNTPLGGPTWAGGATFYASTSAGGTGGKGTIFKINGDTGVFDTLVNFTGANGAIPVGELLLQGDATTGIFYGVTRAGGAADKGTVFKMTPGGNLTTLASFTGANGSTPRAGLAPGPDGNFYGTTEKGGANDLGTVFQITPAGVLTVLVNFDGTNGSAPWGALTAGADGNLYGTTSSGGLSPDGISGGGGQIFRLRFPQPAFTLMADSITNTAAVLHGKVIPMVEGATSFAFEYGTDSTLATFSTIAGQIPGGYGDSFEAGVSDLSPLTTYYFRSMAVIDDASTIRGEIQSFTTLPALPDIAVNVSGQANLASDSPALVIGNTAVGQSRDLEITVRTSAATSTLASLSASLANPAGPFRIVQQPAASVAYGNTTTVIVRFSPTAVGGATATLAIASDDADENPFTIHLRAWGGDVFGPIVDPINPAPVVWDGFIATGIDLSGSTLTGPPRRDTEYVILDNPGANAVEGTFNGLPEGSLVTITYGGNNYRFFLSYTGGDGNDIVLSYWPETGVDPKDSPEAFLFAALDSDRDDKLTPAEWQAIYSKIPKKETIFRAIDANTDGFLTFAEFTAGVTNRTASRTISTAVNRTAVFMEVDTSYDNIVSRAEINFMWKPGTAKIVVDAYWIRAKGGRGMDFWDWLWAPSLPSFTIYDQANNIRAQRLAIAGQLDVDTSGTITFAEFTCLYKPGTKTKIIDTAWRAANATPGGTASPANMTVTAFVEAPKLPKLVVY